MIRGHDARQRLLAVGASLVFAVMLAPLTMLNRWRARRTNISRILVLEPWGIGDLVLATGALRELRRAWPAARITVLAKGYARPLLVESGAADECVDFDFPWTAFTGKYRLDRYRWRALYALIQSLRAQRFDLAVNARSDVRNNVLMALIGAGRSVSLACGIGDFLVTDAVPSLGPDAHRVEDWAVVVARATDGMCTIAEPRLEVGPESIAAARIRLGLATPSVRPVIGLHPGARIAVRRWDLDRFAAVADTLVEEAGARVIVFAEPDGFGSAIPMRHSFTLVRGSLPEMMAASACCDVVLCNDSGPMHVVASLGVPVVAIFGPTRMEWFGPRGAGHRLVRIEDVPCRPCFDKCAFAEPHCMTGIGVSTVMATMREVLALRESARRVAAVKAS